MNTMPAKSLFPNPERLADDVRNTVISSAVIDTVFYFLKGLACSPSGHRLAGRVQEVASSVPTITSSAAKSGVDRAIELVVAHARQTDDHWNSVVASGSVAALFAVNVAGPLTAVSYGIFGT